MAKKTVEQSTDDEKMLTGPEYRERMRLQNAKEILYPGRLQSHVVWEAMTNGWKPRDSFKWNRTSELGQTNVHPISDDNPPYESYFRTEEELDRTLAEMKSAYPPTNKTDRRQFPRGVTLKAVSFNGNIGIATTTAEDGEVTVIVYPSKSFKEEIVTSEVEKLNQDINRLRAKKAALGNERRRIRKV